MHGAFTTHTSHIPLRPDACTGDGPSPTGKGPGSVRGMSSAEVSDAVSHVPRPGERQEMKERAQQ